MRLKLLALLLAGAAAVMSTATWAAEPSSLRVVAVQTTDLAAYTKALSELKAISTRLDSKMTIRAWQATFAGPDTQAVVVSLEYPGPTSALIGAWEKALADPGFAAKLAAMGSIRKIVSDSLYRELQL
jgi:hypothetical protein